MRVQVVIVQEKQNNIDMPDIKTLINSANNAATETNGVIDPVMGFSKTKNSKGLYVNTALEDNNYINSLVGNSLNYTPQTDFNYQQLLGDGSRYDKELVSTQLDSLLENPEEAGNLLNEYRSDLQGVLPSMGNSIVKFAAKTGINIIGGTAGTIYGLGAVAADGFKLSSMWDNDVINELDSWSKGLDAAMPVYKSADYQNANFLEKFIHPVMLFDEFSNAASFTAGAVLTELLTAGLGSSLVAARATGVISKMLKAKQVAGVAERTAVKALGYDALKFGRKVLTGANYEASVEANQAKREYKQLALQDYMQANNIQDPEAVPTEVIDKIDIEGNSVGNTVWGQNLAILHASHMLQFPSTFGNTFNTARKFLPKGVVAAGDAAGLGSKAVKGSKFSVDDVAEAAYKTATRGEKIASNAYTFSKNALTEGLWEEGMQTTVSEAAKNYWQKKYDINNLNEAVSYADSFGEGLAKSYGTKEGWNSIGMGMLIGMVGSPGKGLLPGQIGIDKQTGKRADMWQGGALGEFKERDKKRAHLDRLVEDHNTHATNAMVTPAMVAGIENLAVEQSNTSEENSKIENDDKFGTLNVRDDKFTMFVDTRNKTGKFSTVEDTFDSMERMTPEEFKQNFYDQTNDKVIDRAKQQEIIKGLRDKANKIRETRGTINAIIQTDPFSNYNKTTEAYKDQLVYEMSKADMTEARSEEIIKLLGEAMGNHLAGQKIKDWHKLAIDTNMSTDKVTTLKNHAKGMNLQIKKLEKSEPELTGKINKNIEEEKVLSTKLQDSSKKRDDIVRKIQKASDKLGLLKVTTLETNVLDAKTKEVQQEIDSLNKEIEVLDADTANTQAKLDKNKEAHTKYSEQLAKDKEDTVQAQKEYDDFVKDNLAELQKKAKDKSPDTPQFKYDNYEEYAKAIGDLLFESEDIQKTLQDVYGRDPLKAEEIQPLVTDLGKLTRMRYDLIDMYNLHRSAEGRAVLMASIESRDASFKERIAKQINLTKDITDKFKLGNTFKIVVNEDGEQVEYLAKVMKIKGEKELGILLMNPKTLEAYQGGAFKLDSFKNLIKQGYIESIEDFTEEEIVKNVEKAVVANLSSVNYDTGVYTLTGDLVEVDGDQYLKVTDNYNTKYYEVDEDGNINPHYETSFETEPTLVKEKSKHEFNGQLYNYTSKEGNKSIVVGVDVSPFLSEDAVEDLKTYPSSLTIEYYNGETEGVNNKTKEGKDKIKELVDKAKEASANPLRKNGSPIIEHDSKKATIKYSLTTKVKTTRKYRGKDKKMHTKSTVLTFKKGENKMVAYKLEPKDSTVEELLATNEPLTSNLFEKTTESNKGNLKVSNFAEAEGKAEIVQDKYQGAKGKMYVIVKFKDNLYAVPMKEVFYQIDSETNIIRGVPMTVTPANLQMIGEDLEPEISSKTTELEKKTYEDSVFGKLIPDFFYTAGSEIQYEAVTNAEGKTIYFLNQYNPDGTLKQTEVPAMARWFNFLKDKNITSEEFAKKYKLRFVINNGQYDEVFDKDDSGTTSTEDVFEDGKAKKNKYNDVDLRVVIVDITTGEPIEVDGLPVHTSVHSPKYEGVEKTDIDTKTKDLIDFRKAVIDKLNESDEEIYTTVETLTEGSVAKEQPSEIEYGTEGKKYKARRRSPVRGRIIGTNESFDNLQWGVVKLTSNGIIIPVTIGNDQLTNSAAENGMVFTSIKGRNDKPLKVKLLTRPVNESEAITVAQLIRLHSSDTTTKENNPILPTQGDIGNKSEKPIISRFIKWGVNKNNPKTQIFFEKKTGTLNYGENNKITKGELKNNKAKLDALISWLQTNKIAHVAERFKGDIDFFTYEYNTTTEQFDSKEWNSYNEYLFSDENGREPILTTDTVKANSDTDNSNQIVQVNIRFDTTGFIKKPVYRGKTATTKATTKPSVKIKSKINNDIEDIVEEVIFQDYLDKWLSLADIRPIGPTILVRGIAIDLVSKYPSLNMYSIEIIIGYVANKLKLEKIEDEGILEYLKTFESTEAEEKVIKATTPVTKEAETVTNVGREAPGVSESMFTNLGTPKATPTIRPTKKYRLINTKQPFTQENEKEAKEWFNKTFPNIPIEYGLFKALTQNNAWGILSTATGVLISGKANKGTTYHEGWHVVSHLGLSDRQLKALYDSVRKELKDDSITDAQAEEILADDFMNWKLSGKSEIYAATEVKRSMFEKILDFITNIWETLFSGKNLTALQIYTKINNGGYSKLTINTKAENKNIYRLQGLTVEQSEDLLSGISYNVVETLYSEYNGEISSLSKNLDAIVKKAIKEVSEDDYASDEIKQYVKTANAKDLSEGIKQYFEYIGLGLDAKVFESDIIDPLEEANNNQELGKDNVGNIFAESVMFSSLKSTSKEIKILIATLPEQTVIDGETSIVNNSSGLVKTVNFGKTYVTILEALQGTDSIDVMKEKLAKLSKTNPEIEVLLGRLNALKGDQAIKTWMEFRQAFSINKYEFQMLLAGKGAVKFVESNRSKASDKVKEIWNNGYKASKAYSLIEAGNKSEVIAHLNSKKRAIDNPGGKVDAKIDAIIDAFTYMGIGVNEYLLNSPEIRKTSELIISDFIDALKENNIYDLTKQFQTGRYNKLAEEEAKSKQLFLEPQHLNPENKSVYEYSLNTYITTVLNDIKQCASLPTPKERLAEFMRLLPHLYAVKEYSVWIREILNDFTKLQPEMNLNIAFLEGTKQDQVGSEGKIAYDLSETSIANLHLHAFFNKRGGNYYPMMPLRRPSDKSLEPALVGMPFITDEQRFVKAMKAYLRFELNVAKNDANKLVTFKVILGSDTLNKIGLYAKKGDVTELAETKSLIEADIRKFLNKKTQENIKYFKEIGVIGAKTNIISNELISDYSKKGGIDQLVKDFTMNYTISVFEQMMMFHGDFSQYKDFFKRTSGYVGTGKTLSRDAIVNDKIQSDIISFLRDRKKKGIDISKRMDLAFKLSPLQREEFTEFSKIDDDELVTKSTINSTNIVTIKEHTLPSQYLKMYEAMITKAIADVKEARATPEQLKQYMSAYEAMDIADGLGMITLEEYRNFLLKTGGWDLLGNQEKTYQRAIRGEKLSIEEVAYFPMLKPQGFGIKGHQNTVNADGSITSTNYKDLAFQTVFEKLAFIPIIPSVVKGLEFENLLKSMQQSGATVAIMETGIKVGKERPVEFNGFEVVNMDSFNMDMKWWKIQVDMHSDIESEDTDGTQQRKLLWQDLFVNGKAIDPQFQKSFDDYVDTYQKLIDTEKKNLLEELSIEVVNGKYIVTDNDKFTAAIRKEVSSRRLPSNILNAITTDSEGNMLFPIDALPIASKIENILLARVNNNLIKLKRPGAAYVQTSNLFWKSTQELNATQQVKAKQFAENLQFIRQGKDGKIIGAEIMLPASWLSGFVKEGDDINELIKSGKLDPRLLNVMGYRIPTQGQNSMLPLIIKGFLPAEMGDTVIMPYEIVAQSGSDFDIDKMHIFRPNYYKKDGKLIYLDENSIEDAIGNISATDTYEGIDAELDKIDTIREKLLKKVLQNKLLNIQLETLTHPANLRNLLVPNSADFLKEEADFIIYLREEVAKKVPIPGDLSKDYEKNKKFVDAFIKWRSKRAERIKKEGVKVESFISFKNEVQIGLSFKGGKKGVSIVANQITAHSLFQQAGTRLSGVIKTIEKTVVDGKIVTKFVSKPVTLNFKHNVDGGKPSLAGIYDVNGNLISEVNSEHLTGNVDIAKDPFIFTLNTNGITSNVKYMLLNLGADRQWVNRFINQPVIEEYVNSRLINESIEIEATKNDENTEYLNDDNILESLYYKYGGKALEKGERIKDVLEKIHANKNVFTEGQLNRFIVEDIVGNVNGSAQIQLLADFVSYQEYGKAFNNGIQSIQPDTRRIKNMDEAGKVLDDIENVAQVGFFENIDTLLSGGLLKGFNSVHAGFMKKLYKSLFVTELDSIQGTIYDTIKKDVTLDGFPITSKELDIIKQSVLTYLFQVAVHRYTAELAGNKKASLITKPIGIERIKQLMTGENSIAKLLQKWMKNNSTDNSIIGELLYPELSDSKTGLDLIKTVNKIIDAFTSDRFSEAFEELYQKSPELYNVLVEIASIEFGMTNSPISYMKYLDSTRIGGIFSPILKKLMKDDSFVSTFDNIDSIIDSIYIINRQNNKLVPKLTMSKIAKNPQGSNGFSNKDVVLVSEKHNLFGRKFIKQTKITKDASGMEQWSNILYKLEGLREVKSSNKDTKEYEAIYVKVNIKGGYNLKEFNSPGLSADVKNHTEENRISLKDRAVIEEWIKKNIDTKAEFERVQKVLNQPFPSLDDFLPTTETKLPFIKVGDDLLILKDGKSYLYDEITGKLLEDMKYTKEEMGRIYEIICGI